MLFKFACLSMKVSKESKKHHIRLMKDRNLPRDEFMAACVGDAKWLHYSLRDGHNPSMFDKDGLAPIHLAALHGQLDCLRLLVENYSVDVNLPSQTGHYPLLLAINQKNGQMAMQCMMYLLEKGAFLDCTDRDGDTAVHKAAAEGLEDCLRFLLAKGTDADLRNVRDKSAHDLAKIWGKRNCARVVQKRVWDHDKDYAARERLRMIKMQKEFQQLQQEALHQIMNEHDFFGNVSFNNWMEKKGYKGDFNQMNSYTNKKQTDSLMAGLISRLFANGSLKDVARRLEKVIQAYVRAAELKAISGSKFNTMSLSVPNKFKAKGFGGVLGSYGTTKQQFSSNIPFSHGSPGKRFVDGQRLDKDHELFTGSPQTRKFKPTGIYEVKATEQENYIETSDGMFKRITPWNRSTNKASFPMTDISHPTTVPISTQPDIDENIVRAPGLANLSFDIKKKKDKIVVKIKNSSGQVEVVQVPITSVAPDFIIAALGSLPLGKKSSSSDMTMFEFKCIHLFDIQRKRPTDVLPLSEIVMHLKSILEGYLFGCKFATSDDIPLYSTL